MRGAAGVRARGRRPRERGAEVGALGGREERGWGRHGGHASERGSGDGLRGAETEGGGAVDGTLVAANGAGRWDKDDTLGDCGRRGSA